MSLDQCACKRGFFTLRDCGHAASTSCTSCTRRVCAEHLAEPGLCVECAAKRDEDRSFERVDVEPTLAAAHYRRHWYSSGSYSPVWWGTSDAYWDDTDYRWYSDDDTDDDDGGGFEDS